MKQLPQEIEYFFVALTFFTRLPVPKGIGFSSMHLQQSRKYFPLVGIVVGLICAAVFYLSQLLLPLSISVLLCMIAGVLVTGAFHEDGLADSCDAFGGGWDKKQTLAIMKDSRIGSYGTLGVSLTVLLKFFVLFEIAQLDVWLVMLSLICAHSSSRFIASSFVQSYDYVREDENSKSKPIASLRLSLPAMLYSFLFVLLPLFFLPHVLLWLALPIAYLSKFYLGFYFKQRIGGYTGDCLGLAQQVSELLFYLSILSLWMFISFDTPV